MESGKAGERARRVMIYVLCVEVRCLIRLLGSPLSVVLKVIAFDPECRSVMHFVG